MVVFFTPSLQCVDDKEGGEWEKNVLRKALLSFPHSDDIAYGDNWFLYTLKKLGAKDGRRDKKNKKKHTHISGKKAKEKGAGRV